MAKFAYPIPNGKVNSEGLTKLISTLYTGSGVVFADSLTVSASDTPDMNVVVSGSQKNDVAVFIADSGSAYTGWNNNDENVVIDANATGNTMIDTIVAYIDLAAGDAETANAPDGLSFMAIRGAGADTAPTDGAIDTAVGHSLWIRLANVSIANGASSINSGNITDVRAQAVVAKQHLEPIGTDQVIASGASVFRSSSLSISNGSVGPIPFDAENFDTDDYHSTSSDTSRLVAPTAGIYLVSFNVAYSSHATGYRAAWITRNGSSTDRIGVAAANPVGSTYTPVKGMAILSLSAGDYVELIRYQSSGTSLALEVGDGQHTTFSIARLGN